MNIVIVRVHERCHLESCSNVKQHKVEKVEQELLIPIPITRQTDGQQWKKSHNEVSKIVEV